MTFDTLRKRRPHCKLASTPFPPGNGAKRQRSRDLRRFLRRKLPRPLLFFNAAAFSETAASSRSWTREPRVSRRFASFRPADRQEDSIGPPVAFLSCQQAGQTASSSRVLGTALDS